MGGVVSVIGMSIFCCSVPIYALRLGAIGGAWCDAVERFAIILAVPSLVLFAAGMHLIIGKSCATLLVSVGGAFFAFSWFGITTFFIGLLTGKGW
jgi:hypothetical protein